MQNIESKYPFNQLVSGLTYDEYAGNCAQIRALRSSQLKVLMKSPRHLKVKMDEPEEPSDAMAFGSIVHLLFENPWKFMDLHVVEPVFQGRTQKGELTTSSNCKEVKEKRAAWREKLPKDAIVLKAEDAERIYSIHNTLKEKKLISNILKDGIKEQSLWVKDPETGVALACRPDFITAKGHVIDIKTTRDASPNFFLNEIFSNRGYSQFYVLQAAHYTHCLKTAGISDGKSFLFIAMENQSPFEMRVFPLDEGALDAGDSWRQKLTKTYADCLMSDRWPRFDDTAFPTSLPSWFNDPPVFAEEEP
jgi:hypothetical protein